MLRRHAAPFHHMSMCACLGFRVTCLHARMQADTNRYRDEGAHGLKEPSELTHIQLIHIHRHAEMCNKPTHQIYTYPSRIGCCTTPQPSTCVHPCGSVCMRVRARCACACACECARVCARTCMYRHAYTYVCIYEYVYSTAPYIHSHTSSH